MNNRITKTMRAKAGFTLVELIVVIAILGILAGVGTVGYSGYIKKANEAADQQLLGYVNQAFAAACLENGVDASFFGDNEVYATLDAGKVESVSEYSEDFAKYYAGNENSAFKVATYLNFVNGMFTIDFGDNIFSSLVEILKGNTEDIANVNNSTFMTANGLGVNGLLNKVNDVSDFAAGLLGEDGDAGAFAEVMGGDAYKQSMAAALGVENAATLTGDALNSAIDAKLDDLGLLDESDPENSVKLQKIMTNSAVLFAAQNTDTSDAAQTAVIDMLTGTDPKKAIKDAMTNEATAGQGLSQAAMAYGLYTAYAYSTGDATLIENTKDPLKIMNALDDDGFQSYLKDPDTNAVNTQAKTDLQGYMSAMNMVTQSAEEDPDMALNVLINGFDDPALAAVIQQVLGQ